LRARSSRWAAECRLAGASPAIPPSCAAQPLGTARWRRARLPVPPPALCRWLTWRECWRRGQGRRNLRPRLDWRRSRYAFPVLSPPRPPAGRTRPPTRNGFRFLLLCGRYAGSDHCGRAHRTSTHRAIAKSGRTDLCVAVMQVDEVGGGDLRRMAAFRRASRVEMRGWPTVEGFLSASVGTSEPVGTLDRGLECRSGGGRWLSGRKPWLPVGERRPAGARVSAAASGELAVLLA